MSQEQVINMLHAGVPSQQIEAFARKDGVDFKVTPALENEMRKAGATVRLIQLLKKMGNEAAAKSPTPPGSTDLAPSLRAAQDALDRKDYAGAVQALKIAVADQPRLPAAWFDLGFAYTGLHETGEAIKAYQKTLELAPDLFEGRLNLGILLLDQNKPQAALEHLQKAVALKPDHVHAHLIYARALAETGQPDSAVKEYQEAVRLDPHLAVAQLELGQIELAQKHPAEALSAFQQALGVDSKLMQAELGSALATEAMNDPVQAVTHYEKYLESQPDDWEAQFHLARLYLKQKENEKARNCLESVYRVKPDAPGLITALGDVNALMEKLPEAEKYYRLAERAQPNIAGIHCALGQVLLDEKKYAEAQAEFQTTLKLDSHSRDAAIGLVSSLDLQNRYREAIPLLEQLVHAPDPAPYMFFVLATCYDHLMARKEALANYEHFLQLSNGKFPDQEWQATQRAKLLRRVLSK